MTTPETTLDRLRTWAQIAAGDIRRQIQNVDAETSNEAEYHQLIEAMQKAQVWLKQRGVYTKFKCQGNTAIILYMGYKFTVKYNQPKHIKQAATSIQTYKETHEMRATQEQAVALYMLARTAAGQPVCTHDVVQHFRSNPGLGGPSELNSGSRSMNTLHREGCTVDGVHFRTVRSHTGTNPATRRPTDYYYLCPATKVEPGQQRLF